MSRSEDAEKKDVELAATAQAGPMYSDGLNGEKIGEGVLVIDGESEFSFLSQLAGTHDDDDDDDDLTKQ